MRGLLEGSEHKTNSPENTGAPLQLSDAIDRLLANPELLSTVASAIGAQSPMGIRSDIPKADTDSESSQSTEKTDEAVANSQPDQKDISAKLPDLMANAAPIIAALSGTKGGKLPDDDRTRLLCALKPHVNPHRKEAIDTIVNLARISEVIKTIK